MDAATGEDFGIGGLELVAGGFGAGMVEADVVDGCLEVGAVTCRLRLLSWDMADQVAEPAMAVRSSANSIQPMEERLRGPTVDDGLRALVPDLCELAAPLDRL